MSDAENPGAEFPQPRPMPFGVPIEIGGYRIQRVLGSGGMATVFAALQKQPRRTVALKVMKVGMGSKDALAAARRFKREVEILGRLNHPNIAQVFGAGTHDDGTGAVPYFVMEYISGARTILEYVAQNELDLRDRLKLLVKVCAGVDHGHRNKIIHRDLKPGNILIDQYGEPKIIDFGVAHAAELDLASQTMHTEAGRLVGTLSYMAPEQLDAQLQDLDARCDVYALGGLLYKLLTGRHPHDLDGLAVFQAVQAIREKVPIPPGDLRSELRGDLETVILKAMDRDRTQRYRNAGSLGRDILRYLSNKPIHARRASLARRATLFAKRHRTPLTSAAIVLLVMVLALGIIAYDRLQLRAARSDDVASTAPAAAPPSTGTTRGPTQFPPQLHPTAFTLDSHTGRITALAFSSDGTKLASSSFDHRVIVWDLKTRAEQVVIAHHKGPVQRLAFAGDGSRVASAADEEPILICDAATGKVHRTIGDGFGKILALTFSPDAERLGFAGDDLTLRIHDLASDSTVTIRSTTGPFTCASFDAAGAMIVAGSQRGNVSVWSVGDARRLHRWNDLAGEILAVGFMNRARSATTQPKDPVQIVVGVSSEGKAATWCLQDDELLDPRIIDVRHKNEPLAAIALAQGLDSSAWLALASGQTVALWSLDRQESGSSSSLAQASSRLTFNDTVAALAISRSTQWIAVGGLDGKVQVMPVELAR